MPILIKAKMLSVLILASLHVIAPAKVAHASEQTHLETERTQEQLISMHVMISKLRQLMINIKDIDALTHLGLPEADAKLMRTVLNAKFSQTRTQTLSIIWSL